MDEDGVRHQPLGNNSLASNLLYDFIGEDPTNCTLQSLCQAPTDCTTVGTTFTGSLRKPRLRSVWAYFVITAIADINQQLYNQFQALQSAAIEDALAAFNIDDYSHNPVNELDLRTLLQVSAQYSLPFLESYHSLDLKLRPSKLLEQQLEDLAL